MIEWTVLLIGLIHCVVFLNLLYWFRSLSLSKENTQQLSFTVIIPVRNEESNILKLVQRLESQDFPTDKMEIIVVNDHSEDNTLDLISQYDSQVQLRIFSLTGQEKGKKAAISLGIAHAAHDIILTTDGDCLVPPTWVSSFNRAYDERTKLVVGPVRMTHSTLLGAIQSFDFSILIGYAASLVGMGIPSMSNGANLSYRKAVFQEVDGYTGNEQIPSGDDEFILLKIVKKYPGTIKFLKDTGAVVSTVPKDDFNALLNQRVRWLSKWTLHKNPKIMVSVVVILIDNLAMILGMLGMLFGFLPLWIGLVLIARLVTKGIFSAQTNKILQGKTNWLAVIIYEFVYPFYVLLLSFASIFGHYTWKGRKYA